MKIGLLECDHVMEKFRPIAGDYREMFTTLLGTEDLSWRFFDVCNGGLPESAGACDLWLTTGSRFSAYDSLDWIERLKSFVVAVRNEKIPFVGVCFGHQILAEALGGEVRKAETGWGVGVHEIQIIQREAWMAPELQSCRLQFMHQDQVTRLPEGATLLGQTTHCPTAMFRVDETMFGVQAHPEFSSAYGEALIRDRIARIGEEKAHRGLETVSQRTDHQAVAAWIRRFADLLT
jgi:GMP synthase-like glutamine amidotransferase